MNDNSVQYPNKQLFFFFFEEKGKWGFYIDIDIGDEFIPSKFSLRCNLT